jgi:hypothetical protein
MSDEGAIDERIKALVDAHRPELERLVDQALERELNQTAKPAMPAPAAKTTSKRCEGCTRRNPGRSSRSTVAAAANADAATAAQPRGGTRGRV